MNIIAKYILARLYQIRNFNRYLHYVYWRRKRINTCIMYYRISVKVYGTIPDEQLRNDIIWFTRKNVPQWLFQPLGSEIRIGITTNSVRMIGLHLMRVCTASILNINMYYGWEKAVLGIWCHDGKICPVRIFARPMWCKLSLYQFADKEREMND